MMNHLIGMKVAWPGTASYVCPFVYVLGTKTSGCGTKPFYRKMAGNEDFFQDSRWGIKFSLIVRNYPPLWYPGFKIASP